MCLDLIDCAYQLRVVMSVACSMTWFYGKATLPFYSNDQKIVVGPWRYVLPSRNAAIDSS